MTMYFKENIGSKSRGKVIMTKGFFINFCPWSTEPAELIQYLSDGSTSGEEGVDGP